MRHWFRSILLTVVACGPMHTAPAADAANEWSQSWDMTSLYPTAAGDGHEFNLTDDKTFVDSMSVTDIAVSEVRSGGSS